MPMKRKNITRKLNLLEPGLRLCKLIGLLGVLGLLLYFFGHTAGAAFMWGTGLVLLFFLLILVGVEQRQDHRLYLAAKAENPDIE